MTLLAAGWLAAVCTLAALSLGALGLSLVHGVTGGPWGATLRPSLDAAARLVPLVGLMFLPLLFILPQLYPWAAEGWAQAHPDKAVYLNPGFFAARLVGFFLLWTLLAYAPRRRPVAVVGLMLLAPSLTLAGVDWLLSLDPRFASSGFGFLFMTHLFVGGLSFAILAALHWHGQPVPDWGLGEFLMGAVLTWIYFAGMHWLVVWSTNLPEEAGWYLLRMQGGWLWVVSALVLVNGVLPFFLLLWPEVQRWGRGQSAVAALLLAGRAVEMGWLVLPAVAGPALWGVAAAAGSLLVAGGLWGLAYRRITQP